MWAVVPLFVVVWALAIVGISFEIIGRQRQPRWVTILIYLFMGWLVVFRLPQLIAALDPVALALLAVAVFATPSAALSTS